MGKRNSKKTLVLKSCGLASRLKRVSRCEVKRGESLSKHTSFRIGGPARLWIEPMTVSDLVSSIQLLEEEGIRWVVLGNGTNVLFKRTIQEIKENFVEKSGIQLQSLVLDVGWQNSHTLYEVDTKKFSEGLSPIVRRLRDMRSNIGLWLSTTTPLSPSQLKDAF